MELNIARLWDGISSGDATRPVRLERVNDNHMGTGELRWFCELGVTWLLGSVLPEQVIQRYGLVANTVMRLRQFVPTCRGWRFKRTAAKQFQLRRASPCFDWRRGPLMLFYSAFFQCFYLVFILVSKLKRLVLFACYVYVLHTALSIFF